MQIQKKYKYHDTCRGNTQREIISWNQSLRVPLTSFLNPQNYILDIVMRQFLLYNIFRQITNYFDDNWIGKKILLVLNFWISSLWSMKSGDIFQAFSDQPKYWFGSQNTINFFAKLLPQITLLLPVLKFISTFYQFYLKSRLFNVNMGWNI